MTTRFRSSRRTALHMLAAGAASLALLATPIALGPFTLDKPPYGATPSSRRPRGQLLPLAATGSQRWPLMPDVPSIAELKQPKLVLENFFGLSRLARLPEDVVARLNAACDEVWSDGNSPRSG